MTLTNRDASVILAMIARGDKHHDVAAWFGENQARVDDVKKGLYTTTVIPAEDLPPKGPPGLKGRRLRAQVSKAIEMLHSGHADEAMAALQDALDGYSKNEA